LEPALQLSNAALQLACCSIESAQTISAKAETALSVEEVTRYLNTGAVQCRDTARADKQVNPMHTITVSINHTTQITGSMLVRRWERGECAKPTSTQAVKLRTIRHQTGGCILHALQSAPSSTIVEHHCGEHHRVHQHV
jgi:hypothetical protein